MDMKFTEYMDMLERNKIEQELNKVKEELERKAEDKYRQLFSSIDEGLCLIDVIFDSEEQPVDFRVTEVNPAFYKHMKIQDVVGKLGREILPHYEHFWIERYGLVALTGEPLRFEHEIKELDSWYSVFAFRIDPIEKRVAILFKNITGEYMEKKELEHHLQIQDQMFSNAAHELRTPLNVLLGAIQLMEKQQSEQNQLLGVMKQNCYRLIRLVNNIIDVSKIESNFMNTNSCNQNLVAVVENIALSVVDYAKSRGIEIIFDTDSEELSMAIDCDLLERVLLNLLSNAIKFTDSGGTISVSIGDRIAAESKIKIVVKDTGCGIPQDKLELIFQRYGQVTKDLNRNAEGSGIGLHLAARLVDLMGGCISVNSKIGEGSEFTIDLPFRLAKDCTSADHLASSSLSEKINVEFSDIYSI